MSFSDLFQQSLARLKSSDRALEIELLIGKAFGLTRIQFWAKKNQEITDKSSLSRFLRWFNRLQNREPLTYILGEKEFYSNRFSIRRGVLIPRPETEILVEAVLPTIDRHSHILDIGSGSGIIAISLALQAGCHVTALERSRMAFPILESNICRYRLEAYIIPVLGDLFPKSPAQFTAIVSNPPYLSISDWQALPDHISRFEPKMALVAGPKGTEVIERILDRAPDRLIEGGLLFLEVGAGQRSQIDSQMRQRRFRSWRWIADYQGIDRVLRAET